MDDFWMLLICFWLAFLVVFIFVRLRLAYVERKRHAGLLLSFEQSLAANKHALLWLKCKCEQGTTPERLEAQKAYIVVESRVCHMEAYLNYLKTTKPGKYIVPFIWRAN